jgi:hypothetical protein
MIYFCGLKLLFSQLLSSLTKSSADSYESLFLCCAEQGKSLFQQDFFI